MAKNLTHRGDVLDETMFLSLEEFCQACHVEMAWVEELISYGVVPAGDGKTHIAARNIVRVRKAQRLQHDLDLNTPGVALALELLDEIERLRAELARRPAR